MSKGHVFLSEPLPRLKENKTTNMLNPNNYDSDRPNYIKKLLPKDPYHTPCPKRLRNAQQGFNVKQVTLNYPF